MEGHSAPVAVEPPLVNTWSQAAKVWVFAETGCLVSWREGQQWGAGKRLVAAGPLSGLDRALTMACQFMRGEIEMGEVNEGAPAEAAAAARGLFERHLMYVYMYIHMYVYIHICSCIRFAFGYNIADGR